MALYMWRGTGSAFWLPETIQVADGGPELTMFDDPEVIDLTDGVTGLSGFETTPSMINTPVLRSRTSLQIPGESTFGNPQLVIVDDNGVDADALKRQEILDSLVEDVAGTLVFFMHTQVPAVGERCYWLKASVNGQVPALSLDAQSATVAINLAAQSALKKGAVVASS